MRKLSWMETGHPVRAAQIARDPEPRPFMCGGCGMRFASKSAKRRHKLDCADATPEAEPVEPDEFVADEDKYTRVHITPEIKARAAAEWLAMDWRGRLPEGWAFDADKRRG